MVATLQDVAACTVAAVLIYIVYSTCQSRNRTVSQPPGPPGLPIVGNLRDFPHVLAWETFAQWSHKYGSDVVRINILGINMIFVNSLEAAIELLERRSSKHSDRHRMLMLNELCGFGWMTAFRRYDAEWRDSRRAFHQNLGPEGIKQHRSVMLSATHVFLRRLAGGKPNILAELRHLAGTEIMRTAYGIDVLPDNDPYIETAEEALKSISAVAGSGVYLVDMLPFLKHLPAWMPGAKFQREAKAWKYYIDKMREDPWKAIKRRLADGELPDCAATSLLDSLEKNPKIGYTEATIQSTLASMYTGGADTTVSSLGSFFLAMVLNPDIQRKGQEQLDKVCVGRLPDFSDRLDLPYVDALIMESLRWNPVAPFITPHRSSADDVYNGYFIPEGSLLIANNWAILHDEKVYPDAFTFNPDRFMKDGKINSDVQDPTVSCFGFGRRICPGRHMAYESMWIAIASTLAAVTISKAKGPDGKPITPKTDYEQGVLSYPKPFQCDIQPRSAEHRALIEATGSYRED